MKLEDVIKILNLANTLMPEVLALLTLILKSDPNATIAEIQTKAQTIFSGNKQLVEEWLAAHPEV